jgi:chromosome segregation ATPase
LQELEEVLFSLKCALDHLKEASKDVLERPGLRHGGSGFKEKLDVMINSCASTLQELDTVTKKYRDVEGQANKGKTKLRTLEDVKKSLRVNWQRVRWDQEKQSLQQYREKLKSHTDAINLILTSMTW